MSAQTTPPDRFVVVYRTGGTMMCTWRRVLDTFEDEAAAHAKVAELAKAGYRAIPTLWRHYINIGLPIGWEPYGVDWELDHICYVIDPNSGYPIEARWTSHELHS